jgi:DNA polymerase-3 subunit gamma/tau
MSQQFQVIARKWRPQTFDEVVGQQHVVKTLRNAIQSGRIAHGYLFVGPRGTGKTTLARIFAKALNCTNGPKADFDPQDPACIEISEGRSMDVIEIDGASNNGVDNIRDLRDEVRYAPSRGQFKVYIIDEVHMLSAGAFNALLKTLEEPPPHVKFIFATTEVQKVLPTILSRVQRFDLKPIEDRLIIERLGHICREEQIDAAPEALAAIARLADGGMRDAQSILDQMISFCGNKVSAEDVFDVYGLAPIETLRELARAVAAADHEVLLKIVDELDSSGRNLLRVLTDLQTLVRQALLESISSKGTSSALGPALRTEQLTLLLDALRRGEETVKFGVCERVDFEVTLLKAVEESRARAIDALINELAKLAAESDSGEEGSKKNG